MRSDSRTSPWVDTLARVFKEAEQPQQTERAATAIINADCLAGLKQLGNESVQCCVTSPPYWALRDYQIDGQLGLERTPGAYIDRMVEVFAEVRRVLRKDGTLWLNIGDTYNAYNANRGASTSFADGRSGRHHPRFQRGLTDKGLKNKDMIGIPWRLAIALQADGWFIRQDIIWHKPNHMPESVADRCTRSHEHVFLLTKAARYRFDRSALPGRCPDVWSVNSSSFRGAHFATMPVELAERCIRAGVGVGGSGVVLDPFLGSGTTAVAATRCKCEWIGIELSPEFVSIAEQRIRGEDRQAVPRRTDRGDTRQFALSL